MMISAEDQDRVRAALEQRSKLCRTEAASHKWTGERFKGVRQALRDEATECIALVGRLQEEWAGPPEYEPEDAEAQRIAEQYEDAAGEYTKEDL